MTCRPPCHLGADGARRGHRGAVAGRGLYRRLEDDWLLIAGRNFFNRADWCTAATPARSCCGGSRLTSRCRSWSCCPTGRIYSELISLKVRGKARQALIDAARAAGNGSVS